jgi:hypothetical protein
MPPLDADVLDLLDRAIEVDVVTSRRDGSESRLPIWVVVADGEAYVRSFKGEQGAWYRRARADGRATIEAEGRSVPVALEPEDDPEVNRRISEELQRKYGERSPRPTAIMVNPEVSATTLRLAGRRA